MTCQFPAPTRRFMLAGLVSLLLAGCASVPADPAGPTVPVTLTEAFAGQSTGQGMFRVWLTGDERRFTARLAPRPAIAAALNRTGQRSIAS